MACYYLNLILLLSFYLAFSCGGSVTGFLFGFGVFLWKQVSIFSFFPFPFHCCPSGSTFAWIHSRVGWGEYFLISETFLFSQAAYYYHFLISNSYSTIIIQLAFIQLKWLCSTVLSACFNLPNTVCLWLIKNPTDNLFFIDVCSLQKIVLDGCGLIIIMERFHNICPIITGFIHLISFKYIACF